MRIRNGLVLCLILTTLIAVGCRKALVPNVDSNQPPETWITAAPVDTITIRDATGHPSEPFPIPGTIPFKFHVYWAGSDPDGAVTGFYYAVVETLITSPVDGSRPPLPGPKARDYRFTTHTDTTFIFDVSSESATRQHAFFIYAVDDKGKPDPTPARVIFNAQDQYPPLIEITEARGEGVVFERLVDGSIVQNLRTFDITDTANADSLVSSFAATTARIDFQWRSQPVVAGNPAVAFNYKLDEPRFVVADSSVKVATYNSGLNDRVGPGLKIFTLWAVDQAGWHRQTRRRFQFNLAPTTWFSGPDPNAYPYAIEPPGYKYYDASVGGWPGVPATVRTAGLTGSLLSPDSAYVLPAQRPERKTFFEIYKNRIYVRSEWDTVNMNSWVVVSAGGMDPDAPYDVKMNSIDPDIQAIMTAYGELPPVFQDGPANGSPIGFHSNLGFVTPNGRFVAYSQTGLFPIFDPTDPQRSAFVNWYWASNLAGQAYMFNRSEDSYGRGVGGMDEELIENQVPGIVQRVGPDGNGGSARDRELRKKIITFYVDRVPRFRTELNQPGQFYPLPGSQPGSRSFAVNLLAEDPDPYDIAAGTRPGGPTVGNARMRWTVTVKGQNIDGRDTSYVAPASSSATFNLTIPSWIVGTDVTLDCQLCDCANPEIQDGSGRCINLPIPIVVPPPATPAGASSMDVSGDESGPGSDNRRSASR